MKSFLTVRKLILPARVELSMTRVEANYLSKAATMERMQSGRPNSRSAGEPAE